MKNDHSNEKLIDEFRKKLEFDRGLQDAYLKRPYKPTSTWYVDGYTVSRDRMRQYRRDTTVEDE